MADIPYILITTRDVKTEDGYEEKDEYFFVNGDGEDDALERFLRENPNTTFEKMIIVPLAYSYKFVPGVDFPTLGDWIVTYDDEYCTDRFKFFWGPAEADVLNSFLQRYEHTNPTNIKIRKVSNEICN